MKPRLPIHANETPTITGSHPMTSFLAPVNHPNIAARIGHERVIDVRGDMLRTQGETFKSSKGEKRIGGRYLILDDDTIVAAVNTMQTRQSVIVSNIAVAEHSQRKGLATRLIEAVKADHAKVSVDSAMTVEGAAFFGYGSLAPRVEAAQKALAFLDHVATTATPRI